MSRTLIEDDFDVETIRPVGAHILIREIERETTLLGLYLPKSKGTECVIGEVVAVGKEIPNSRNVKGYPIEQKKGDLILTMGYVGDKSYNRFGKFRFINGQDVWATLKMKNASSHEVSEVNPQFSCILIEPISDEVTKGGIILNQGHDATEGFRKAIVLKVGPGIWEGDTYTRQPMSVKEGDEVLFRRYAGADLTVNGKLLRIIDYGDIKAGIERGPK